MSTSPPAERLRLFVALELPGAIRAELEAGGRSALRGVGGVRLVRADALHVTLCFLGWRELSETEPIAAACEAALEREDRLEVSLGESVWLPARAPRVLAVRVEDHAGALARMQRSLSAALSAGGWYARETRPFLGHVTIARLGRGIRLGGVEMPAIQSATFEAARVTLFSSRLEQEGARYEALRTVELRA